jgi:hypothetical protein
MLPTKRRGKYCNILTPGITINIKKRSKRSIASILEAYVTIII